MATFPVPTVRQKIARGMVAWDRDEYAAALSIFQDVLQDHPDFADVHNRLGLCLAMLGRHPEALAAFQQAIRLAPTYAEAHLGMAAWVSDATWSKTPFWRASSLMPS